VKVDHQINRPARGNPLLRMRRCITQQPKTLNEISKQMSWSAADKRMDKPLRAHIFRAPLSHRSPSHDGFAFLAAPLEEDALAFD